MKKILFVLLGMLSFCSGAFARDEEYLKHELYVNVGLVTGEYALPENVPYFKMANAPFLYENKKYSNMVTLGYMINLSKRLALGFAYSECRMSSDLMANAAEYRTASVSAKYNVWMLNVRYQWLNFGELSLYSRAGGGSVKMKANKPVCDNINDIGIITGWENKNDIAWHVAPLGIQYTLTKHLGLFVEGGMGVESCLVAGLKIIF